MLLPRLASTRDAGADLRDRPPKACLARLPNGGGWCVLPDGHAGDHLGYASKPPPPKPPAHSVCQCSCCEAARKKR